MLFCVDECTLRTPIFWGVLGVAIWAIVSSFILWRNYKSTGSKQTLSIFLLFIGLAADYLWQTVLTYERSSIHGGPHPTDIWWLLVAKNVIWVYMWGAITYFLVALFGVQIKAFLRRWIND
jgi:hypothetical protein